MSIQNLRATFGPNCHWCGLPMDFAEPRDRPESATIEHLNDATLGSVRKQKHRRLAHAVCNHTRNALRLDAERRFQRWVEERVAAARTGPATGDGAADRAAS
ncbi:MAG: hypothetical protein V4636_18420 [Pseudomonadota bacterium]